MYFLKRIWLKARYSSFFRLIFDGLARLGIRITPFYIVLEGLFNGNLQHLEAGFDEYVTGFLGPEDMKTIFSIPGIKLTEAKLLQRLREGKKCLGVKSHGELVAFTWCDFDQCDEKFHKFLLKDDEAYLFDAYTLMPFRGKGIAPYMRYQCYKELAKSGRHKLYSLSFYVNTSSLKFKKKLNAKFLELRLSVDLFGKWHFSSQLKKFRNF